MPLNRDANIRIGHQPLRLALQSRLIFCADVIFVSVKEDAVGRYARHEIFLASLDGAGGWRRGVFRLLGLRRWGRQFLGSLLGASGQSDDGRSNDQRSEEHTSELQSLMRISYAVFCLKKKKINHKIKYIIHSHKQKQR